jgi:hypothetical protein
MSIECDTPFSRPPPESLENGGKRLKSESEPEPEPKPKQKPIWESKAIKDLKLSDFSIYDDDIKPFMFMCGYFTYRNKAQIKKDMEIQAAIADYKQRSRNLSVSIMHLSIYFTSFCFQFHVSLIILNNTGVRCYPPSKNSTSRNQIWGCSTAFHN